MTKSERTLEERFWKYVARGKANECWPWIGSAGTDGRGQIHLSGKPKRAHRVSYTLHYGLIPDGLSVLHRCDNPPCVNPKHLFLGTQQDNLRDAFSKNRMSPPPHSQGEDCPKAKLTWETVKEIRNSNEKQVAIARRFEISQSNVSCIRLGKTWKSDVGKT